MYHSLKRQQRVRIPGGGTMLAKPISSGRESPIAASEEADLVAISTAVRKGRSLFFVRTDDGVTLDVALTKQDALAYRESRQNIVHRVSVYERIGSTTALKRVA
jgi:hypothetical protein